MGLVFVLMTICILNLADTTLYREPLSMDDVMSLFSGDECIDGTLSLMEVEQPVFKLVPTGSLNPVKKVSDTKKTSPLSSLHELAFFNNLIYKYNLIEEHGPSHKKRFVVNLVIGEEKYQAEGSSIKLAQQEAAHLALNSTLYTHPPKKRVHENPLSKLKKTAVQKLSDWVTKHSDTKVVYYYSIHSKSIPSYHENVYHWEAENIHKVTVSVNDKQFIGEGISSSYAKENAAKEALKNLREVQGMCLLTDSERGFLTKVFGSSDEQSPVSLVHEFSSITQTKLSFDLVAEEGPPHLKNFIYKCTLGSLETYGEDSSKTGAKREAAEKMVELLKVEASRNSGTCTTKSKKRKSKTRNNIVKSNVKTFSIEDDNYDFHMSEIFDPVSKLFQIQQKTRGMDPVFKTLSEKSENNQFLVEVMVEDMSFIGSGPNKKVAKKSAAEGILTKMGYSTDSNKFRKRDSSKVRRSNFHTLKKSKSTPIGAGLVINSENVKKSQKSEVSESSDLRKDQTKSGSTSGHKNEETNQRKKPQTDRENNKKPLLKAKSRLENLSQQHGFQYQFSDFPKGNNTGFMTLLALSTDPAKVCYGVGETVEYSQDRAALSALENIYKTELTSISEILRDHKAFEAKEDKTSVKVTPVEINILSE